MAHYNSNYRKIITRDVSTKGLGALEQQDCKLKLIGFVSRFLSDTEKKYAISELEVLAVLLGLEQFCLCVYEKPMKLTDHQSLEPLSNCNRSNKTYSARITRCLDRLEHFPINVSHIAGKHLALTDYLSINPSASPHANDTYNEEYVNNNLIPHYKFVTKFGCLSNHFDQSQSSELTSEPKHSNTREQTAITSLINLQKASSTQYHQKRHCA